MNKEDRPEGKNDKSSARESIERKVYEKELKRLHVELVKLQEWVKTSARKSASCSKDATAPAKEEPLRPLQKGSAPAYFASLPCPPRPNARSPKCIFSATFGYLPAAGEIVIFDRSWYNRAGVERVMEFCTEEQAKKFLEESLLSRKQSSIQALSF